MEEVSRQQVACFFPVASHSWLGAPGHEESKEHAHFLLGRAR